MRQIFLAIMVLSLLATLVSASEARTESAEYAVLDSFEPDAECGPFHPLSSSVCFAIKPGESIVRLTIAEESPTQVLGEPIPGTMWFVGGHAAQRHFCGQDIASIPEGATSLVVQVHTRLPGFCWESSSGIAVHGSVTATFT